MTRRRLRLPPNAQALLSAAASSCSGEGYLVGGSLRGLLLERPLADLDLAVAGDALSVARALADRLGGHFVALDEERDVARVVLDAGEPRVIDIARLHADGIAADLARRDFTIDAIAAPLAAVAEGQAIELIDPHGGQRDLKQRVVRLVSEQALIDDPLRLLRAVRLAVQLEFRIEPATADAVRRHATRIHEAAAERQREELVRCFATPRAAGGLRLLDELGLLEQLFPEVCAGRGVTQPKEHYWDVFDHVIETVAALDMLLTEHERLPRREEQLRRALWRSFEAGGGSIASALRAYLSEEVSEGRSRATLLKIAGLLHDVAKPETRAPDETGRIRFFGHAERGAETARLVTQRLRFSRRETELVATMVEEHLRPTQLGQPGELPTRRALYRFFRDTGEAAEGILLLSLADALAARGPAMPVDAWRGYVAYIGFVLASRQEEAIVRPRRLISGDGLMAGLGLGPGPEVGRLLATIEEAHAAGEITTSEDALALARRLHDAAAPEPALVGKQR